MTLLARPLFLLAMLLALGLLCFWPGLTGGFLFDDYPNLVLDPDWKLTSLSIEQIQRALHHGIASPAGRPLAILSFAMNHAMAGMAPYSYKLTNVLFHLANACLVWLIARWLLLRTGGGTTASAQGATLGATLLTACWMLHPLQASSVLYIVQRMELGAATGTLTAVYCYIRGRSAQLEGNTAWGWFAGAVLATVGGFGFKETTILTPGFTFLVEALVLRFRNAEGLPSRGWIAFYAVGLAGAIVVYARMTWGFLQPGTLYELRDFSMGERLLSQGPVLIMYLKQILFPLPESMTFYYDNFPVSRGLLSPPWTLISLLLLTSITVAAAMSWRRWPLVAFGIGWFLVAHVLTSNIVPLELAFEHRNYLATFGILLALVTPLRALARKLNLDAALIVGMTVIIAFGSLCAIQASTWGDPLRLAWTFENRNPTSPRASYGLGRELLVASGGDADSPTWSLARQQFEHAASLPGGSALALQAQILMQARAGRKVDPALWQHFRDEMTRRRLNPETMSALHSLTSCQVSGRCEMDPAELLRTFLVMIEKNPDTPVILTMYANFAWNVLGDRQLAVRVQREAVTMAPENMMYRVALAKFLKASGHAQDAEEIVNSLRDRNTDGSLDSALAEIASIRAQTD